jgi:hypothetical protein
VRYAVILLVRGDVGSKRRFRAGEAAPTRIPVEEAGDHAVQEDVPDDPDEEPLKHGIDQQWNRRGENLDHSSPRIWASRLTLAPSGSGAGITSP